MLEKTRPARVVSLLNAHSACYQCGLTVFALGLTVLERVKALEIAVLLADMSIVFAVATVLETSDHKIRRVCRRS